MLEGAYDYGHINEDETRLLWQLLGQLRENAIHFPDSAAARPLMKLAHRIQHLEEGNTNNNRHEWLDKRRQELRDEFEERRCNRTLDRVDP